MGKYFKYAVGEILLVMVGILLALQVSEWNTNRKRQKLEIQILKDLNREFLENKEQLDTVVKYHKTVISGSQKLMALFPLDLNTMNIDSVSSYISDIRYRYTFNPQQTTINTLTNSSSFDLISNIELLRVLQRWTELYNDYQEEEIANSDFTLNHYYPYLLKNTVLGKDGLKNPKVDLSFLTTIEFENMVRARFALTTDILGNDKGEKELEKVYRSIHTIIELTALKQ